MTNEELALYIDSTLLKPEATTLDIANLCGEAAQNEFKTVCINPVHVAKAHDLLRPVNVGICTVVGFPLGASHKDVKMYEAAHAVQDGATEIDMVMNVGALLSGDLMVVRDDIEMVLRGCGDAPLKVILETSKLTNEQIVVACKLAQDAGAAFVKTSTGFGGGGATLEHIRLMREAVGPDMGVKASGGIRDRATALAMIEAGATRIGTSNGAIICS